MSYMAGSPNANASWRGGLGCSSCAAMGADEVAQRTPVVAVAAALGLVAGIFLSKKRARR